jgi:hypothetical protein
MASIEIRRHDDDRVRAIRDFHFYGEQSRSGYMAALHAAEGDVEDVGDILPARNAGYFAHKMRDIGIGVEIDGRPAGPQADLFPPGFDAANATEGQK